MGHCYESPLCDRHRHHNATLDTMSQALRRVAWTPFSNEIEQIEMPRHFTRLLFTIYDGKTDLMEHVSHYISHDVVLFLERWFDVQSFPI